MEECAAANDRYHFLRGVVQRSRHRSSPPQSYLRPLRKPRHFRRRFTVRLPKPKRKNPGFRFDDRRASIRPSEGCPNPPAIRLSSPQTIRPIQTFPIVIDRIHKVIRCPLRGHPLRTRWTLGPADIPFVRQPHIFTFHNDLKSCTAQTIAIWLKTDDEQRMSPRNGIAVLGPMRYKPQSPGRFSFL